MLFHEIYSTYFQTVAKILTEAVDHPLAAGEINAIIRDSVILLEQLRTIDKQRLKDKVCHLDREILRKVERALLISLDLNT